jgi:hypothetical protein
MGSLAEGMVQRPNLEVGPCDSGMMLLQYLESRSSASSHMVQHGSGLLLATPSTTPTRPGVHHRHWKACLKVLDVEGALEQVGSAEVVGWIEF